MNRTQGMSDRELMLLAIELARKCRNEEGKVSPKVGVVVSRDGVVVGKAFRGNLLLESTRSLRSLKESYRTQRLRERRSLPLWNRTRRGIHQRLPVPRGS